MTALDIILIAAGVGICQRIYDKFDEWYYEYYSPKQISVSEDHGEIIVQTQGIALPFKSLKQYKAFIDNNLKSYEKLKEEMNIK